jgi:small subunit ribosomal protein S8
MIAQIKNGQAAGRSFVAVPHSVLKQKIADVLVAGGFVAYAEKKNKKLKKGEAAFLEIGLKYINDEGVINGARMISKPSRKIYARAGELYAVRNGYGLAVVTTSKGVMSGKEARKQNLGGEVFMEVW